MESPYKQAVDSPSRQLLWELGQLRIDADEDLYSRLERETRERERTHHAALAAAAAEHERVRQGAEIARERFQLELDQERKRREDEERSELDRKRQEKAAQELERRRREIERARKAELDRKKAEDDRKTLEDAEAARKAQKQKDDEAKVQRRATKEDADKKARTDAFLARAVTPKQAQPPPAGLQPAQQPKQPTADATSSKALPSVKQQAPGLGSVATDKEAIHKQYLDIHQRLKQLRKFMVDQSKRNPALKAKMGDMRRKIKKCLGQLTKDAKDNQAVIRQIIDVLLEARNFAEPKIDVRQFLLTKSTDTVPPNGDGPALLLYLINIFAKAVISQFINEAGVKPEAADPIGIIAVTVLARPEFQWQGRPLTDILNAKFHVVCPVLWGIYGNEKTNLGKQRLGWSREEPGGAFVTEQRHNERMTGLGAGFAAISLRDFKKSRYKNPYPNVNYWQAMASIVNVPPSEVTQTHFIVLKAMTENYEEKFLRLFGSAAVAALKRALVDFPKSVQQKSVAQSAISVLPDIIKRDKRLTLTA
ncbi:MAG: hypothetical protein M1836_003188 [Candelina mexicana]|nr:MAG: hypothetical protein M1836_003188 [Candelina mexicana]